MITKPEEHEINRAGKLLLRSVLEPLGWVVNDVQEDYGVDSSVQIFDGESPNGEWFHVQLKSSASTAYSADGAFLSQELPVDHARHYAVEIRQPILLVHADVASRRVYWCAPQLDRGLATVLGKTGAKFVTLRIPTCQRLPDTIPELLTSLKTIYVVLASRVMTSASAQSFAESLKHLSNQDTLQKDFQEKSDTLKLRKIRDLFVQGKFSDARARSEAVLADPDSIIEIKFWAQVQLGGIDAKDAVHSGKPQIEMPRALLASAKSLQRMTKSGPKHLKFYALIARHAAQLHVLAHEDLSLYMAFRQHFEYDGDPMMALNLFVRRLAVTRRLVSEYNRCVRLARYAANYPDRWMLGRALSSIPMAIGKYLITLQSDGNQEAEEAFAQSALQICKLAAWICAETGDSEGVIAALLAALTTTLSTNSEPYRWAVQVARGLADPEIRDEALGTIERARRRWAGECVPGDYNGDVPWQAIQNMATGFGIDLQDESDPLVRGLKLAAKDDSPARILARCEHILVTLGAAGPIARTIGRIFNTGMASSKVVNCTLHDFHVEGRELDMAYAEFKAKHCDSCPDLRPRPDGWQYTEEARKTMEDRALALVARLAGTVFGSRFTPED